ncbi:Transcription factor TFIIIB component B'' [Merluccius polli]|uniref:Transcription factor TFIIIB component B n=1 Tax=Merluccius polli TaxID=89951 RepID=A0AA47P793_MERPO|nr:Transcription factor TFIIIB component B'' [Merluccius polli]
MIRRSRISVRPNVGRPGRAGVTAAPQDAPTPNETPAESAAEVEDNDNSATAGLTTAVQGRKRFSVKPKVSTAPNRASAARPNPNAQTQMAELTAKEGLGGPPDLEPLATPTPAAAAAAAAHHGDSVAQAHEEGAGAGDKPTDVSEPDGTVPAPESPVEDKDRNAERLLARRAKEVPPKPPDEVPVLPSLPEKEAREISERAKTLVSKSSKVGQLLPQKQRLSHLLHDQTDLQRLAKTRRLRELLRQEMGKEKEKQRNRKSKYRTKEYALDPSKMTMRDLVYYLPVSNPMTSYLEEPTLENETVVPPSPAREESPEKAQDPETASQRAEDDDDEVEEEGGDGEGEDAIMVPRVKVAEDGSLIIDEESLTVEVKRAKGPNPANDRDAIFERGSTTTYSSFRKKTHTKTWSSEGLVDVNNKLG